MQKITKNRKKVAAIFASFLLHLALFLAFFSFKSEDKNQPEIVLEIELITPSEAKSQSQKSEKIHLKKDTHAPSDHVHLHKKNDKIHSEQLDPIFHPLPAIPEELRDEAFSSKAVARFYVGENGEVAKVELIQPCSNPRLNVLLLKSLQKWKFPIAATGKTQEISVTFLVK
jgi:outer membrane biosynthesis protein TonB